MNDELPVSLLGSKEKKFIPKSVFNQVVSQVWYHVRSGDSQKQK